MLWMNLLYPKLPTNCDLPPTIYSILESYVNFDSEDKKRIKDLAKYGRGIIFNFDYPLTTNESREKFECMILNHFLMRRIGYDTVTAFRIALDVKLNEIMPFYNKMFDMLNGWDLFNDGETITRSQSDTRNISDVSTNTIQQTSNTTDANVNTITQTTNGTDSIENTTSNTNTNTSDRRNSNTPQNELSDVRDGKYVSNYDYDTNTDTGSGTNNTESESTNTLNSRNENNSNVNNTLNSTNSNNSTSNNIGSLSETITRTPADKIRIYKEFMENRKSIYTLIFEELDPLFYGLV